ncbi:MAG: hypothetical protein J5919_06250, partial [Clostridia bacterium]|nr:hypothetical protein [Clostridia bacterium]
MKSSLGELPARELRRNTCGEPNALYGVVPARNSTLIGKTAFPTDFFVFLKNLLTNGGRGFIIFGVEGKGVFEPCGFKGDFSL